MCAFAGMQMATVYIIPVNDAVYRDKCANFNKLNDKIPEKAHLYC